MARLNVPTGRAGPAGRLGWILFDFATQPYFTLILTFVFAPYFASAVAATPAEGQALWGYATAAAALLIALTAPLAGAVADVAGGRKRFIAAFGLLMMAGTAALWFVAPGEPHAITIALLAFMIATLGVEYATVFNNAMMPTLAPREELGRLSGNGWAAGYVGGLLALVVTLGFLAADPASGRTILGLDPLFGLDPATREGDRASGPLAALWFLVFSLPLFLFTPDLPARPIAAGPAIRAGLARLRNTLRDLPANRNAARFLLANMIYTDGLLALFTFGGVYAAGVFGWTTIELGLFGILLTVTGTAGALIGGRLDDRIGSKPVVLASILLLLACLIGILSVGRETIFFVVAVAGPVPGDGLFASPPEQVYMLLGALIGIAAGPVQAASRTLLVSRAPPERTAEWFGLFALTGKITSFAGPFLVALATDISGSQRLGVVPLIAFFVLGGLLLLTVRLPRR